MHLCRALLLGLAGLVIGSCGSPSGGPGDQPVFLLHVGSREQQLPVHADPAAIQDELLAHVRPLWDGLGSGYPETFQFVRTTSKAVDPELQDAAEAKHGKGASLTMTSTCLSPQFRFFKGVNGRSGLQQLSDDGENLDLYAGPDVSWQVLAPHMRDTIFSRERVKVCIQNDLSE